jgi:hypothetical protein
VPDRPRELFAQLSKVCHGFSSEEVAAAAINLMINAIRQTNEMQSGAARSFDELAGRAKHLLLEQHYSGDGKRRNVFPHTQTLEIGPPGWNKNRIMR